MGSADIKLPGKLLWLASLLALPVATLFAINLPLNKSYDLPETPALTAIQQLSETNSQWTGRCQRDYAEGDGTSGWLSALLSVNTSHFATIETELRREGWQVGDRTSYSTTFHRSLDGRNWTLAINATSSQIQLSSPGC
jgi:hypothetical protein